MRVDRFLTAGTVVLSLGALGPGRASAQLLSTGVGSLTSAGNAGEGVGEGVDVSTATSLTQLGFYLGTPNAATNVKYLIYDATANALVYSQTKAIAAATADNTLVLSNPFTYSLLAGRTYYFGVVADNSLDVSYSYVSPTPLSSNGLTLDDPNIVFGGFDAPTTDLSTAGASIALQLYGTQGATSVTPEPNAVALLAAGLAGAGVTARRRRATASRLPA